MENAGSKKAKVENFITRFARYYTPVVTVGAAVLAVVLPLVFGGSWGEWVQRACIFLVISCPCALVVSVPLSFFGGIGGASRSGVLIKGANYLEALSQTEIVVFDKTGTLTQGVFRVTDIQPEGCTEQELLETAALAESYSDHPISRSLKEAFGKEADASRVTDAQELSGRGVRAVVDGKTVYAGNEKLMAEQGIRCRPSGKTGTVVHVAMDGRYLAILSFRRL